MSDYDLPVESLDLVLRYLDLIEQDTKALRSSLFVNKQWNFAASRRIWRKIPAYALGRVERDRRPRYSHYIHEIEFSDAIVPKQEPGEEPGYTDIELHHQFRKLDFSRLKSFTATHANNNNGERLPFAQYIQENLEKFTLYGTDPDDDILELLETRCANTLTHLDFCFDPDGLTSQRLQHFFDNCPFLKSLFIRGDLHDIVDVPLLQRLATYRGLQSLKMGVYLRAAILEPIIFHGVNQPFKDIRHFQLWIPSVRLSMFAENFQRHCPNLISLHLTINDSTFNPVPELRHLTNLQELRLVLLEGAEWPVVDIRLLGVFMFLRVLVIYSLNGHIRCPSMRDRDFLFGIFNKRYLKELDFQIHPAVPLTSQVLRVLGRHCWYLMKLRLCGKFDLRALKPEDDDALLCTYPILRRLELGGVNYAGGKKRR